MKGTFRWLATEHFGSVTFNQLDLRTQHVTRLIVEKLFLEPIAPGAKELFGDCPIKRFNATAVRILRDRRADNREAANNRVKRLRRIFAWALENGITGVAVNPARDVPLLKPERLGGFPTWTSADVESFEKRHPIGSKARLALALLTCGGNRSGGWGNSSRAATSDAVAVEADKGIATSVSAATASLALAAWPTLASPECRQHWPRQSRRRPSALPGPLSVPAILDSRSLGLGGFALGSVVARLGELLDRGVRGLIALEGFRRCPQTTGYLSSARPRLAVTGGRNWLMTRGDYGVYSLIARRAGTAL